MANERQLIVSLTTKDKGYSKGMRDAQKSTQSWSKQLDAANKGPVAKFGSRVDTMKASLGGLGTAIAGAFAVQKIVDFGRAAVAAASDLEQAIGGVETVFGDASREILDFSENAAQAVGLSERAANQLAARLGGQLQSFGFSVDEAADKTKELIRVGADLAATYGGSVEEAVSAISSLLRGERDPIERYAVSIKQADINARALALGLGESTSELDNQALAVASLDLLMGQTRKTQGQFAREANTAAGKQERLTAEWENAQAAIGEALLPAVVALTDAMPDLTKVAAEAAGPLAEVANAIALIAKFAPGAFDEFNTLPDDVQAVGRAASSAESDLGLLEKGLVMFGQQASRIIPATRAMAGSFSKTKEEWESFHSSTRDADRALLNVAKGFGKVADDTEGADRALLQYIDRAEEAGSASANASIDVSKWAQQTHNLVAELVLVAEAQGNVNDALLSAASPVFAAVDAWQNYLDAVKVANEDGTVDAVEKLGLLEDKMRLQAVLEEFGDNYQDAMNAIAIATGTPVDEIEALLAQLDLLDGKNIVNTVTTNFVTNGPQNISNKGIQARASGGPVKAGDPYLVGEQGRELFVPATDGRIVPNDAIRRPDKMLYGSAAMGQTNIINQTFQRVEGNNIATDIQRGVLLAGLGRHAETA